MKIKWYKRILPPACLAIFLFRLLEVRMVTDSATGMVKVNSAAEILFNVVLAALALFFCSALFMKREPKPAAPRLYRENKSDAIFGIGGAVLTVTAGLFRFFSELTDGVFALDLKIFGQAAFWQLLLGVISALFLIFYVIISPVIVGVINVPNCIPIDGSKRSIPRKSASDATCFKSSYSTPRPTNFFARMSAMYRYFSAI